MKSCMQLAALMVCGAAATVLAGGYSSLPEGMTSRTPAGGMAVSTSKGVVEVTPFTKDIFRVTVLPQDSAVKYYPSQAAVLGPSAEGVAEVILPGAVEFVSSSTRVSVDRTTGAVTFYDSDGNKLLSESGGVDNNLPLKSVMLKGKGLYYGAGERGHRPILNGDSLTMYNRQNYGYTAGDPRISQMGISVPYFASDAGYGVLFDDYNAASLELRGDSVSYRSETPRALSYYFINSPSKNLEGVVENYTLLTGRQPLPPLWSLGYITSKYGYHNQREAEGAIDSLKTRGYPVDGMVLDLYWYGVESDMGRLEWDPKQWPDHRKMLADMKDKGVNMVLISQPYINKKGAIDNYNYLAERGMLALDSVGNPHDVTTWVGDAGMFDVSNPATRQWYWNRYKELTADGVAGWWGDLGEPEVHPSSIYHHNGQKATEYHNVYGNEWSRIIYEGLRADYPEMRPLLMMRGGTAGLQRYGVFPWTTDVSRSWGGFRPQVNLMLSSGVSGLGYMGSDVGGFAVDNSNPTDPELYTRWLQMGVFSPMLRTHAQLKPEPYHYPGQEKILKEWIRMRYDWLPYNYTLAYENAAKGLPLARPLNFGGDNPGEKTALIDDEYLWGGEVLVAPVMEKGARKRNVYFPKGEWISWWNPAQKYAGGRSYSVAAPLDRMPIFVKAGSFIPQYLLEIENVTQYDPTVLTVRYYPSSEKSSYTLFEDDGKSPVSLEENAFTLITFSGERKGRKVEVSVESEGEYPGRPELKMITLQVEGVAAAPKSVMLDGNRLDKAVSAKAIRQYGYAYDAASRTLSVVFPYAYKKVGIVIE